MTSDLLGPGGGGGGHTEKCSSMSNILIRSYVNNVLGCESNKWEYRSFFRKNRREKSRDTVLKSLTMCSTILPMTQFFLPWS